MQLRLEPVTQENRLAVLSLRAGTGQEGFVETVSACLDEAAQRADWRPMAIYDGTAVVGFAMYGYFGNTRLRAACGWTGCSSTPPGRAEATAEPPWHLCWPAWRRNTARGIFI